MRPLEIEEVYRDVRDRLWSYINSIVRDRDASEDIFQRAWLKVLPAISKKGLNRESLVPYLFGIARNECMDHFRRRTRELRALEKIVTPQETPAADESAAIRDAIDACLNNATLTESRREMLRLRLLGQLSMDEIASILKLSRSTAYRELEAGLQFLGAALEKAGIGREILQK